MSVSGIGGSTPALQPIATSQPKIDLPNDGDGDAGDAPNVQTPPPPGLGQAVDKSA